MTWVYVAVGTVLIILALRDLFSTLWHPRGLGPICRALFAILWGAGRRIDQRGRVLNHIGPSCLLLTIVVWAAMLVVGWALIYMSSMPDGFTIASELDPGMSSDFADALYLSLVTIGTLGFGDIAPAHGAMRIVAPIEALVGFVLFTAAISWVLHLNPALKQCRMIARKLTLLSGSGGERAVADGEASLAVDVLTAVTDSLISIELDLVQYGETYFFRERDPAMSFAAAVSFVPSLVDAGSQSASAEVRAAAAMLGEQAKNLADQLDRSYLHTGGAVREVFAAYAADHRQQPLTSSKQ